MHHSNNKELLDFSIFNRIDMNLYPLFIAVYELQNISKAAALLCISQSAASHALQRLRNQLHDELFVRSGSKMLSTPLAKQLYQQMKPVLLQVQQFNIQQQQFDPVQIKEVHIAMHDEIEALILPQLIRHFRQLDLNIQFLSCKLDRRQISRDLGSQQIDFVIDLKHQVEAPIHFKPLIKDHFVVCTSVSELDLDTYSKAQHIGVSSRRNGTLVEDLFLQKQQIYRQILLRCQHYATALQILSNMPELMLTLPYSVYQLLKPEHGLNIFKSPVDFPDMEVGIYFDVSNLNERKRFILEQINLILITLKEWML